ncbi:hypothetical protein [Thalassoroseus pseudoceratinae]|uniref:hypothetical protein n=1 Tax=Thalassoroseus pseudoceratinae TaxID=2713176 RepID=UPI00142098AB|nr:hypothetical protein [Thalassoroseus pseudoceratinae]
MVGRVFSQFAILILIIDVGLGFQPSVYAQWGRSADRSYAAQHQFYRTLSARKSMNEFDLHRLADFRSLVQFGGARIDPVLEVRLALTFEALAKAGIESGARTKPATVSQRRRIARKLWQRAQLQQSNTAKRAFHRAIAAWDLDVLIANDAPPVLTVDELLQQLTDETSLEITRTAFRDVLPNAPGFRRMIAEKSERYPPPPPIAAAIAPYSLLATEADRQEFLTASTRQKAELLRRLRPDTSSNYTSILAGALLDKDLSIHNQASRILWEMDDDSAIANALGHSIRHNLSDAHIAELIDRIPVFPVYTLPHLRKCYTEDDPRILAACARAIKRGNLSSAAEKEFWERVQNDSGRSLAVAELLDRHSVQLGIDALLQVARTAKSAEVRIKAFEAIGTQVRGERVQRALLHHLVMGDEPQVEAEAAHAFLQIAPEDHPNRSQVQQMLRRSTVAWSIQEVGEILALQSEAKRNSEEEQLKNLKALVGLQD